MTITHQPPIVVVAYNRPKSLERLLHALSNSQCPDGIRLIVSIDRADNNQDVLKVAGDFVWEKGEKEVIYRPENMGLRKHILACGDLSQKYGSVMILEDDLFVSPWFYQYAQAATSFYAKDPQVGGVSLYNITSNMFVSNLPFQPVHDGADTYFLQVPSSWGQTWTAEQWSGFRQWWDQGPSIEASDRMPQGAKEWSEHSWVKYFYKYLVESGKYFVHPQVSYTTNFADSGTHFTQQVHTYQVALQMGDRQFQFHRCADSGSVYDSFFEITPQSLNQWVPELAEYNYTVNLNGLKDPALYPGQLMFTLHAVDKAVRQFGQQLDPFEMNIIQDIPGDLISLADPTHIRPNGQASERSFHYHYAHLPIRALTKLLKKRVQARFSSN
ncbi:MAG: glycosyltransferase [Bacteroidota bacterium]